MLNRGREAQQLKEAVGQGSEHALSAQAGWVGCLYQLTFGHAPYQVPDDIFLQIKRERLRRVKGQPGWPGSYIVELRLKPQSV